MRHKRACRFTVPSLPSVLSVKGLVDFLKFNMNPIYSSFTVQIKIFLQQLEVNTSIKLPGNQKFLNTFQSCMDDLNACYIWMKYFLCNFVCRCLQCKVTLCNAEELRSHVENPACKGPIYAKVESFT